MKHILPAIIMAFFTINSFAQGFYDPNTVTTIELIFEDNNWDQTLDTYYNNDNGERLLAIAVINGVTFDSVAVKYKGNSTFNANNSKNPLNIKLNEFINQDYEGYSTLKMSSGAKDPSFVREVLGYEIARKYMDAPQSNYIEVYINGNYHGLYNNVESINGDFQEKYIYANREKTRVKCNPVDVQNGGSSLEYLGTNEASYYDYYELDTDSSWNDLITLCNTIDNQPAQIEDAFDIDRAIWMLAYNNIMVNLDSYTGPFKQNYYLVMAKNDNMTPLIWDLNESFGAFAMVNSGGGPGGGTDLGTLDLLLRQNEAGFPLLNLILQNDTYRRMYIAHCKTIFEENIANDDYFTRAQELQSTFATSLQNDNNSIYSYADAQTNLTASAGGGGGGPGGQGVIGLKELFDDRTTYLENTSHFQATAPSITAIDAPTNVPSNTSFIITATVSNATNVIIGHREYAGDRFEKVNLLDDGQNGDATANDGIYSITINANSSDIQYYVYAENNDAGIFSPQRAEHEYHSVSTSFDVVINEVQAKNDLTSFDDDLEYDDWIEIYNNSTVTIDLSNYYLSDKGSQLDRWAFPSGTTIAPDEYLIVWADADTFQTGLHANFKLSSSGESIYLSDGNATVYDKVKYNYFEADFTLARLPNGTGLMTSTNNPTHKAHNEDGSVGINDLAEEINFTIYPNPTDNIVHIEMKNNEEVLIEVYDLLGKKIHQGYDKKINVGQWTKGIYLVQVNQQTRKLIVQ